MVPSGFPENMTSFFGFPEQHVQFGCVTVDGRLFVNTSVRDNRNEGLPLPAF